MVAAPQAHSPQLDGIYVIRAPVPEAELSAPGAVAACKNLKNVERDFRTITVTAPGSRLST